MSNILLLAIIGFVVLILAIAAPAILNGAEDFRTDLLTETFTVDTAVAVTSGNIQLSSSLWNENLANITVSSNLGTDAPTPSSYNATNRHVLVQGMTANSSRTIEAVYKSAGLEEYTGAEDVSTKLPTMFIIFIIILAASGMIYLIVSIVRRYR